MADLRAPRWSQDSYAPVAYEFQYSQYGDGTFAPFPTHDLFQSLTLTRGSGIWVGTLSLFDRTEEFLCGPKRPGIKTQFKFKWWYANRANNEGLAPVFAADVNEIRTSYAVEGTGLTLDFRAVASARGSFDKDRPPREFEGGLTATDIVRLICDGMGWPVTVMEQSRGKLDVMRMGGEPHQQFILDKICPVANGADSKEHFVFYFDDGGGVHFHTPSYLIRTGKASDKLRIAREYVAYADMVGEVESFQPHDDTVFHITLGSGDGQFASVDSKHGIPTVHNSTIDAGVENQGVPPSTADEKNVPDLRPSGSGAAAQEKPATAFNGLLARSPADALEKATNLYSRLRESSYGADLSVHGTHGIAPNDYVAVRYFTHLGREHYLSGLFRVQSITHDLSGGGWKTRMTLSRGGAKKDTAEKQVSVNKTIDVTPQPASSSSGT